MCDRISLSSDEIVLSGFEHVKGFNFIRFSFAGENEKSIYISGTDEEENSERHVTVPYDVNDNSIIVHDADLIKRLTECCVNTKIFSYLNNAYYSM